MSDKIKKDAFVDYAKNENDYFPEEYIIEDKEKLELIKKLTILMSDRRDFKGWETVEDNAPEVWMFDKTLSKDEVKLMLSFEKKRTKFYSAEQLAKKNHLSLQETQAMLDRISGIGLIEYDRESKDKSLRYFIPKFVVGAGEYMMMNSKLIEEVPEMPTFFNLMTQVGGPLAAMVPPGGGVGMHVIPVEDAIGASNRSVQVEHLSHWLKKYDKYAACACSCRRQQTMRGEAAESPEMECCIFLGDTAEYIVESGKDGHYVSYEEVMDILSRAEDRGYVHQIINIDGEDKIAGICNCDVGSCNALRTSLMYNTPNLSASAYRAHVDKEKCVACGKCVEVCPAGAAKLGQKLCKKDGSEVQYPKAILPDEVEWGVDKWDYDYRDNVRINCYETGTSPCKTACPAHLPVQGYVELAAQGRYLDAVKLIKQDNPFPAVCGSICNRRCEMRCTRGTIDEPLAIDEIKKFIARQELFEDKRYVPECHNQEGQMWGQDYKIAVIGAGPAGLSCAFYLRQDGYDVTVFDRAEKPGGMMMNGIPNFRLEKDVVNAEIDVLRQMGVEFKCGVDVGKDVTIPQLREQGYKGFYIAIGLQGGGSLGIPGDNAEGVEAGIEFVKRVNNSDSVKLNGKVVVIGGGSIGADVARTAKRCGASSVNLFCLEDYDHMPMSEEDIEELSIDGIEVNPGWGQTEIGSTDGKCKNISFRKCLSVKDEDGRFNPKFDDSETITVDVDYVFYCIGLRPKWDNLLEGTNVKLSPRGFVLADSVTYQADEDIFVGGDIYTGQKFCINAIAAGKEGAKSLHRSVHAGHSLTMSRDLREFIELDRENISISVQSFDNSRRNVPNVNNDLIRTFSDPREPFTEEQVKAEAKRCLHCGATTVDVNKCIGCGLCTTRCMFDAISISRDMPKNSRMYTGEKGMYQAILPYALKRKIKIDIKKKISK